MPELVIKTAVDNGDLPKQLEYLSCTKERNNMTVKELIKELQDYPENADVVVYSTCDGNISVEGIGIAGRAKGRFIAPFFIIKYMTISLINWLLEKLVEFVKKYL